METTPKVSILIPCYNSERFIAETLDSCIEQTYNNIEIIVVDDGSTDHSLAIVRDYKSKDGRVKVISHAQCRKLAKRETAHSNIQQENTIMFLDRR